MAISTEKQLIERWRTPEGKKVKKKIIDHIKEDKWERFLVGFPFIGEVENGRDLRFVDFGGADLQGAHFEGANLRRANLMRAGLRGTYLMRADLRVANFVEADLREADLRMADLRGAFLIGADLRMADLRGADLRGVDLRVANLSNCYIEDIKFYDCQLNNITFESSKIINVDWGNSNIKKRYFKNLIPFENEDGSKDYIRFMETYISLKNQFNKNGLYNDMSWAYLKEKESLRLHYKQNITYKKINVRDRTKSFFKYIWEYILFFLFGYGEKPWHILGWSVFTIIIYGLIYKITNAIGSSLQDIDTTVTFLRSLYFSTITFTTVGFGDFHPLRDVSRTLVMSEAALGLFFYSLFIFTFGRRIAGR